MKDTHTEECYKNGGRKDCPLKGNGSNPKFYAGCYQESEEKYIDVHEVANDLIQQESVILDNEMTAFLKKHNLPMDRTKIRNLGFEIVTESMMPPEDFNSTKYIFKLCKVVDTHKLKIKRNINIQK